MGIIKKQGISNSIIIIIGAIIGAINVMVLFPKIIPKEYFGLTRVLVELSYVVTQFGLLGGHTAIVKFWSQFKKKGGLIRFVFSYVLVATSIVFFLIFYFQNDIINYYNTKSPLFSNHYHLIFYLFVFGIVYEFMASISFAMLKAKVPVLLKEVGIRLYVSFIIVLYAFKVIDIDLFVRLFVLGYFLITILMVLAVLKEAKQIDVAKVLLTVQQKKEILKYSTINFLTGFSSGIVNRLDTIMIATIVGGAAGLNEGLRGVAIYSLALYATTIIEIPSRGLFSIATPMIARFWNEEDRKSLRVVYQKSSINLSLIAVFLFTLLWANIDELLSFLGTDYNAAKPVVFILGLSKLFNMTLGVNNIIIGTSKYYRIGAYVMGSLVVITFALNYYLIPQYGIVGAAIGSLISLVFYNIVSFLFLWYKYGFQPFTIKSPLVFVIGAFAFALSSFTFFDAPFVNLVIKTIIISIVYLPLVYILRLSKDFNEIAEKYYHKIFSNYS